MTDMVNHPQHYTAGMPDGVEVIDIIRAQGWEKNYYLANATKYLLRCEHKGTKRQDLEKLLVYVRWELDRMDAVSEAAVEVSDDEFEEPPFAEDYAAKGMNLYWPEGVEETGGEDICGAAFNDWECTRLVSHGGHHMAGEYCGTGRLFAEWA